MARECIVKQDMVYSTKYYNAEFLMCTEFLLTFVMELLQVNNSMKNVRRKEM